MPARLAVLAACACALLLPSAGARADNPQLVASVGESDSFLSDYRDPPIPPGKKSIAFSVAFQSSERTLTDEDAAVPRDRIVKELGRRFGATLRA